MTHHHETVIYSQNMQITARHTSRYPAYVKSTLPLPLAVAEARCGAVAAEGG